MDCSIFVKNGPCLAGLGYKGEGYCSFTIASPTGEGLTGPRSFSRLRRCTWLIHFVLFSTVIQNTLTREIFQNG